MFRSVEISLVQHRRRLFEWYPYIFRVELIYYFRNVLRYAANHATHRRMLTDRDRRSSRRSIVLRISFRRNAWKRQNHDNVLGRTLRRIWTRRRGWRWGEEWAFTSIHRDNKSSRDRRKVRFRIGRDTSLDRWISVGRVRDAVHLRSIRLEECELLEVNGNGRSLTGIFGTIGISKSALHWSFHVWDLSRIKTDFSSASYRVRSRRKRKEEEEKAFVSFDINDREKSGRASRQNALRCAWQSSMNARKDEEKEKKAGS